MANRYFIGGGTIASPASYTSTANWSATDGGSGGASVPTDADDRYFNSNAVAAGLPNNHNAATVIGENAQVQWNLTANNVISGSLLVSENAVFNVNSNYILTFASSAKVSIEKNAVFNMPQGYIRTIESAYLKNEGTITGIFQDSALDCEPGNVENLTVRTIIVNAASSFVISGDLPVRTNKLTITHNQGQNFAIALKTPVITDNLVFSSSGSGLLSVFQKFPLKVSGNVTAAGNTVQTNTFTWENDEDVISYFTGTANQSIAFPQWVQGQKWFADKPDGTLDLVKFNGYLQGRCRGLIVRAGSSVDLAGAPPVLDSVRPYNDIFQTAYYGLKKNETFPFCIGTLSFNERCEAEAMNFVNNYGSIHIPAGKVLCTRTLNNGGTITGEGILIAEYGGLTNSGDIAETVKLWFFNEPNMFPPPAEIPKSKKEIGIPRSNVPSFYRLTLAFGKDYMTDTIRLFTAADKYGRALAAGSGLFLARISHLDGSPVLPQDISAASYSVYQLDKNNPSNRIPVEGRADVPVSVAACVLEHYALDANWGFDAVGYNFRCSVGGEVFSVPEENYLVVFELVPAADVPKILLQYRVHCV